MLSHIRIAGENDAGLLIFIINVDLRNLGSRILFLEMIFKRID